MLPQKEHSNIITSLRATNEPLLCVTEIGMGGSTESKDDPSDNGSAHGKSRKKIERNTSAPLPGMLQVSGGE